MILARSLRGLLVRLGARLRTGGSEEDRAEESLRLEALQRYAGERRAEGEREERLRDHLRGEAS